MTQVWQIAAGTPERNYTALFLKYDIMFMGPGAYGDYNEKEPVYKKLVDDRLETSNKVNQVRAFVQDIKDGDIVLLRNVYEVVALGIVDAAGYKWNDTFDDVFGWDLQHTRRVIWQQHLSQDLKDIQKNIQIFGHMKQISTFSKVHDLKVVNPIKPLFSKLKTRSLKSMPPAPPKPLSMDEVGQELFSKGLPNEAVDKVLVAIERQRRLINWYYRDRKRSGRPTEHEVVAHMILPLMLALGWSEQLLAVEWHKIDLAAFSATPTIEVRCVLVCEAKWLGHGLQNILNQAKLYIAKLKLHNCRKILLTDGARLYLYERKDSDWNDLPIGYLNVNSIRTDHIAPENTNAIDTIIALTPSGIIRK